MVLKLPHNILSYLGTHVRKEDRLACALVCKHWKEPFLNAFWGRLEIGWHVDIDTLDSSEPFLINAHRVWAVIFNSRQSEGYEDLSKLWQFFPGIRYLEFHDSFSDTYNISKTSDWSIWKSLTHLEIRFNSKSETVSFKSLFTNLSVLACLVHLTLCQSYNPSKEYTISWNVFESLHYHMPRLEYLNHSFLFEPIAKDDIESIKTVETTQTMTRIYFQENVDTLWLFYFALKYPKLQHLIIQKHFDKSKYNLINYNNQQYQSDLQLLSTLDQFFPCLKTAVTRLQTKNLYSRFIFYETLGHFGTKIKHVYLSDITDLVTKDDIIRCIHPISESLKILRIEFYEHNQDPVPAVMFFEIFSRLVALYIDGNKQPAVFADNILECLPALRLLHMNEVIFSLSTNTHTYIPHQLQKLEIRKSYISIDALSYLLFCCNQLKHLKLANIRSNIVDTNGQLIFDMSKTKLNTFIYAVYDRNTFYQYNLPRHYAIQQLGNDNAILQTSWYHTYCDRAN